MDKTPGPRAPVGLAIALYGLIVAVSFTVVAEWPHYRRLGETLVPWAPGETLVLLWTLVAKTAVLLVPMFLLALALAWRGRRRTAWTVTVVSTVIALGWLTVDLRINAYTGNHLTDYLPYLLDASPGEWGGGTWIVVGPLLAILAMVTVSALAIAWLCKFLARDLLVRWRQSPRHYQWVALGTMVGFLGAALLPTGLPAPPRVAAVLSAGLPVSPTIVHRDLGRRSTDEFSRRFELEASVAYGRQHAELVRVRPADTAARLPGERLHPHVLLIVVESLRSDAIDPRWMPRMHRLLGTGLRLQRHYAATNGSQWGLFALLYGRHPLLYGATLDARVPPQLLATLRSSGYATGFFSSASVRWQRMDEYLNEVHFDRFDIQAASEVERPDRDRAIFDRAVRFLGERPGRPAFAMVFPMATHYLYKYPPEYQRHQPVVETWAWVRAFQQGTPSPEVAIGTVNRYRNALAFLDDLIADVVESLDPARHVIIVTGDHGESFLDDGTWFHLGPLSEVQTRVPFWVGGVGVPDRVIGRGTTHVDVLPTLLHLLAGESVPVAHSHGRDLLARDWPDHVLLAKPESTSESEVVLMRGDARLAARLRLDRPQVTARGLVTPNGKPDPGPPARPEEVPAWVAAFREQLDRLTR